jgi:putative ABC transport system permease protein
MEVIGVVKDFHFRSLKEKIEPMIIGYWYSPVDRIDYFTAEISGSGIPATLKHLQSVGEKFDPQRPFEYNFLDERINDFYKSDKKFAELVNISTILAIFIASLGLLGLSLFTAQQKIKEVGIRKVLGATIPSVVFILTKEFFMILIVSFVISAPAAYYVMDKWLQNFAYRIDIGVAVFLISGILLLLIAVLTVSFQTIKAATANPVKSLRYE